MQVKDHFMDAALFCVYATCRDGHKKAMGVIGYKTNDIGQRIRKISPSLKQDILSFTDWDDYSENPSFISFIRALKVPDNKKNRPVSYHDGNGNDDVDWSKKYPDAHFLSDCADEIIRHYENLPTITQAVMNVTLTEKSAELELILHEIEMKQANSPPKIQKP